jgi:hypothetical protein
MTKRTLIIGIAIAMLAFCSCKKRTICKCTDLIHGYTVMADITDCPDVPSCESIAESDSTLANCTNY